MATSNRFDNVLATARTIDVSSGAAVFRNQVGKTDPRDFLQIQLNSRSEVTLKVNSRRSNAVLGLLNQFGNVLRRSQRTSTRTQFIRQTLEPGTYYVRVVPRRKQNTRYSLILTTNAVSNSSSLTPATASTLTRPSAPPTTAPPSTSKPNFNIEFDYRFDTIGWFTPEKRNALEAAADIWETIIQDDFPNIPAGTVTNGVINPVTGRPLESVTNRSVIDDVLILVGAGDLGYSGSSVNGSPVLAQAAPGGTQESRITGNVFQPWLGSIAFDVDFGSSPTQWFFDPTPNTRNDLPIDRIDFLSTALHEIGHILGIGSSQAFAQLTDYMYPAPAPDRGFFGSNTKAINGGRPIPLSGGHIQEGYQFNGSGETLMDVEIAEGIRTLPTVLDIAILDDIGYSVNYSAAFQNRPPRNG